MQSGLNQDPISHFSFLLNNPFHLDARHYTEEKICLYSHYIFLINIKELKTV